MKESEELQMVSMHLYMYHDSREARNGAPFPFHLFLNCHRDTSDIYPTTNIRQLNLVTVGIFELTDFVLPKCIGILRFAQNVRRSEGV